MVALSQSPPEEIRHTDPVDWVCAEPLIERAGYNPADPEELADAITLVCAHSYHPRTINYPEDEAREGVERSGYEYRRVVFRGAVLMRVVAAQLGANRRLH